MKEPALHKEPDALYLFCVLEEIRDLKQKETDKFRLNYLLNKETLTQMRLDSIISKWDLAKILNNQN